MRSEAWRPAAAACNRLPREARDPARQALRPGCEELAAQIRRQLPAVVGRRAPKDGKRQEILIESVPGVRRIAALVDSSITTPSQLRKLEDGARARGVELSIHQIAWREEIGNATDAAKATGAEALNVLASPLLFSSRAFILHRIAALRLPAIYQFPEMAEQGGLIGYGPLIVQLFRDIMSRQLAKLLRGSKPADLPVEQPTKFKLVINLKTAKVIGLTVPAALLSLADEVIE